MYTCGPELAPGVWAMLIEDCETQIAADEVRIKAAAVHILALRRSLAFFRKQQATQTEFPVDITKPKRPITSQPKIKVIIP